MAKNSCWPHRVASPRTTARPGWRRAQACSQHSRQAALFADDRAATAEDAVALDVVGPPPPAGPASRAVGAQHAPCQAAQARLDVVGAAWVAGDAEAVVEVAVRSATRAGRRGEGAAGQAGVTEVDPRLGPCHPLGLTGNALRRWLGIVPHTGGAERGLPKRGVTLDDDVASAVCDDCGRRRRDLVRLGDQQRRRLAVEHDADHVELVEADRVRGARPPPRHLPGAHLESGGGEHADAVRSTSRCRARRPSSAGSNASRHLPPPRRASRRRLASVHACST